MGGVSQNGQNIIVESSPSPGSENPISSGAVFAELGNKQDNLVTGVNIKRINGVDLLENPEIDLVIEGADITVDQTIIEDSPNPVSSSAVWEAGISINTQLAAINTSLAGKQNIVPIEPSSYNYDAARTYDKDSGDNFTFAISDARYWQYINATPSSGHLPESSPTYWLEISGDKISSIYGTDLTEYTGKAYVTRFSAVSITVTGTNTYSNAAYPLTAYNRYLRYFINFENPNNAASTLSLGGLAADSILKEDGTAVASGDLKGIKLIGRNWANTAWQVLGGSGGVVTFASQAENEAAATQSVATSVSNTVSVSPRGLFWFWDKIKSLWGFGTALTWSTSVSIDLGSRIKVNKKVTATSSTSTFTFTNAIDGCEFDIKIPLSGITTLELTLAGSGLSFKDSGANMTTVYYSGNDGDVVRLIGKVEGTEIDLVTSDGAVVQALSASTTNVPSVGLVNSELLLRIKQGGQSQGAVMDIGTTDAFDTTLKANSVVKVKAKSGGGVQTVGGGTSTGESVGAYQSGGTTKVFEALDNGNVSLGGAGSYAGGVKVMFLTNATTVPSGTPTGGGVLYVEAGVLKYKGSSGTVTTLGAA